MVREDQKFRAEVFKICGFALMTPLGRFVLDFLKSGFNGTITYFVAELILSLILFLSGAIMIQIGYEAVQELNK